MPAAKDNQVIATAQSLPIQKFRLPGRPMKIGRYVSSTRMPGGYGYNAGVCWCGCNARIIISEEDACKFAGQFNREQKSWVVRLMRHLRDIRSI